MSSSLFVVVLDFHLFRLLGLVTIGGGCRVVVSHVASLGVDGGVVQVKFRHNVQTRALRDREETREEQEDSPAKYSLLRARKAAEKVCNRIDGKNEKSK